MLPRMKIWHAMSGKAYARRAVESVSGFDWTHHRLCNFVIVVDGERAHGKVDVVAQMQAPATDDGGAPPMLTVGGRYDLDFSKVAAGWPASARQHDDPIHHRRSRRPCACPRAAARRLSVVATARHVNRHEREG